MSTIPVKKIWPKIKSLSFFDAFPLTKAKKNLKMVMNPQKSELNTVAPCLFVTELRTE